MKDLDFLDSYWKEAKAIADKVLNDLPIGGRKNKSEKSQTSLEALGSKIYFMIYKGDAQNVKLMVEKICTGRIKSLSQGISKDGKRINNRYKKDGSKYRPCSKNFLGRGHFRWNYKTYILTPEEMERVKEFFQV